MHSVVSLSAITYHLVVVLLYKHEKTTTADRLRAIKSHILNIKLLNINLACPTLEKEEKQGHRQQMKKASHHVMSLYDFLLLLLSCPSRAFQHSFPLTDTDRCGINPERKKAHT